jgi:hypothetical protein
LSASGDERERHEEKLHRRPAHGNKNQRALLAYRPGARNESERRKSAERQIASKDFEVGAETEQKLETTPRCKNESGELE